MSNNNKNINKLSKDSRDWLTLALDPYHDFQTSLAGCPDSTTGRSFVRVHNQMATIAATASDDNIRIIFSGVHGFSAKMFSGLVADGGAPLAFNPFMVVRSPAAVDPTCTNVLAGTATKLAGFATTLSKEIPSRLIGLGVEVRDVTAPLYQRGTCAVTQATGSHGTVDVYRTFNGGPSLACETMASLPMLPSSLSNLQTAPGMVIQPAKEGCYTVGRMIAPQPPSKFDHSTGTHIPHLFTYSEAPSTIFFPVADAWSAPPVMYDMRAMNGCVNSGFEPFVINLSGISDQSVFNVTIRTIVEYFPEFDQLTQLAIAGVSPAYDPRVFQIYQNIITSLPIAVPVRMNAKGDFWRMVKKVALGVAPGALELIPVALTLAGQPGAAAVASVATSALGAALKSYTASQAKRSNNAPPRRKR